LHSVLEILEKLVFDRLLSVNADHTTNHTFVDIIDIAQSQQKKVLNKLVETYFNVTDVSRFELYIHKIQNDVTHLADQLYNFLDQEEIIHIQNVYGPLSFKDVQLTTYFIIEDLLETIEKQYPRYFNFDAVIPLRKREIAMRQFSDNLADLKSNSHKISPKLLDIISKPLENFISDPATSTYHRLNYLKKYIIEIFHFRDANTIRTDLNRYLMRKLIYLNFNSISFFHWATSEIRANVNQSEGMFEKLEQLSWYLKEINQTWVVPDLTYNINQLSIKELLSEWIIEEINHLNKTYQKSSSQNQITPNQFDENFKLVTDLSVPQYAFLLRTFVETGLFKNKDQDKPLTKLFAQNTQTKGAETISPKSLRQHFYKDDIKTREVVKNVVIKILNYIQSLNVYIILLSILQDDYLQAFDTIL
jgi:hypothetical protein